MGRRGTVKTISLMLTPTPFKIEMRGKRYRGTWHVEGNTVYVLSEFGSDTIELGRQVRPGQAAELILKKLVFASGLRPLK